MGVLNCTPDSFSDGGLYNTHENALTRARDMIQEGADILDIGGESTRPGADPVSEDEEIRRVVPLIQAIRAESKVPISIDTTKASVAQEAMKAGADIINDVSGLLFDPQMVHVARATNAAVVLMHIRGTPQTMMDDTHYTDAVDTVVQHLEQQIRFATEHGLSRERLILDPGIGFGKDTRDNLRLIRHTAKLAESGLAVLIGPSRKRFLGELTGRTKANERGWATAGAVAASVCYGAHILRVHDVRPMREVIQVTHAVRFADQYP